MRRAILNILGAASVLLATLGLATAQSDYPSRIIRIVVAWPPGSGIDVLVRQMTEPLRAGQPAGLLHLLRSNSPCGPVK